MQPNHVSVDTVVNIMRGGHCARAGGWPCNGRLLWQLCWQQCFCLRPVTCSAASRELRLDTSITIFSSTAFGSRTFHGRLQGMDCMPTSPSPCSHGSTSGPRGLFVVVVVRPASSTARPVFLFCLCVWWGLWACLWLWEKHSLDQLEFYFAEHCVCVCVC